MGDDINRVYIEYKVYEQYRNSGRNNKYVARRSYSQFLLSSLASTHTPYLSNNDADISIRFIGAKIIQYTKVFACILQAQSPLFVPQQ